MRSKKILLGGAVILCTVFGAGAATGAAVSKAEPGSSGDPIVTKSYVDQQISKLQGELPDNEGNANNGNTSNNGVSSSEIIFLQQQIQEIQQENEALKKQIATIKKGTAKGNFKKVTIKQGKTLVTKYGAEVLFYSGKSVWKTTNDTYVVDQTAKTHIKNGTDAVVFHNYLIRSGSNLTAVKDSVVYVKGNYSVRAK